MQTVPKNKSTREHQFSICFWRSKIWKIKKSLKKHKKKQNKQYLDIFWGRHQGEKQNKKNIFGDFLEKAPRRKQKNTKKTKKPCWEAQTRC